VFGAESDRDMATWQRERRDLRGWTADHPLGGYLVVTFAVSWIAFVVAALGGGPLFVVLGAFGPATAAALVTRWTGGSVHAWFRGLWRWRVPAGVLRVRARAAAAADRRRRRRAGSAR
jgi:hypothetical protein